MNELTDFQKEKSAYLTLKYEEQFEYPYAGTYVRRTNMFGQEGFDFTFTTEHGPKTFFISRPKLVAQMSLYNAGDVLIVKRGKQGEKPAYTVSKK